MERVDLATDFVKFRWFLLGWERRRPGSGFGGGWIELREEGGCILLWGRCIAGTS